MKFQTPSPSVSPNQSASESASTDDVNPSIAAASFGLPTSHTNIPPNFRGPPGQPLNAPPPFVEIQSRMMRSTNQPPLHTSPPDSFRSSGITSNPPLNIRPPLPLSHNLTSSSLLSVRPPSTDVFGNLSSSSAALTNLLGSGLPYKNQEISSFNQQNSPPFSSQSLYSNSTYSQSVSSDVSSLFPTNKSNSQPWEHKPINNPFPPTATADNPRSVPTFPSSKDLSSPAVGAQFRRSQPFPGNSDTSFPSMGSFDSSSRLQSASNTLSSPPISQLFGPFSSQQHSNVMNLGNQNVDGNSVDSSNIRMPGHARSNSGLKPSRDVEGATSMRGVPGSNYYQIGTGETDTGPSVWADKDPSSTSLYLSQMMSRPPPSLRGVHEIDTSLPPPPIPKTDSMMQSPPVIPNQGFSSDSLVFSQVRHCPIFYNVGFTVMK